MIANISPAQANCAETVSTLRFAREAKRVKNQVPSDLLLCRRKDRKAYVARHHVKSLSAQNLYSVDCDAWHDCLKRKNSSRFGCTFGNLIAQLCFDHASAAFD